MTRDVTGCTDFNRTLSQFLHDDSVVCELDRIRLNQTQPLCKIAHILQNHSTVYQIHTFLHAFAHYYWLEPVITPEFLRAFAGKTALEPVLTALCWDTLQALHWTLPHSIRFSLSLSLSHTHTHIFKHSLYSMP